MRRPPSIAVPRRAPEELRELAARCEYRGSVEHKDRRSWLGPPQPRRRKGKIDKDDHRQNATICPLAEDADRVRATRWLREAIRAGQFLATDWDGDFPRRVWYCDVRDRYWFGRLINRGAGSSPRGLYKGWPISEQEKREVFG